MICAGYAFKTFELSTVFGCVYEMSYGILTTTCKVHLGYSGGPVLTSDKQLLGLIIGQLKEGSANIVLPSTKFMKIIQKYIHTNG